jgi:hypothetical protein
MSPRYSVLKEWKWSTATKKGREIHQKKGDTKVTTRQPVNLLGRIEELGGESQSQVSLCLLYLQLSRLSFGIYFPVEALHYL